MVKKRYEALYLHPNFCDGFYDNEEDRYLKYPEEVSELVLYKLKDNEIERILNRNIDEEFEEEEKEMSGWKLALEGIALVLVGFVNIAWYLIKLISCLGIAIYIGMRLGLTGYIWLFSSVIIFCILSKILFFGNTNSKYSELAKNYSDKAKEYNDEQC